MRSCCRRRGWARAFQPRLLRSGDVRLRLALERTGLCDRETAAAGRVRRADAGPHAAPNGRWRVGAPRVPIQESDIQTTALVIRVTLDVCAGAPGDLITGRAGEGMAALECAGECARSGVPAARTSMGRGRSGGRQGRDEGARERARRRRGMVATAGPQRGCVRDRAGTRRFREGADMPSAHRAYQRGVAYLLRTQEHDGSWFVHKRAASINPYFESGFPHGLHQFSSFAGTAWATMALMYAAEPPTP